MKKPFLLYCSVKVTIDGYKNLFNFSLRKVLLLLVVTLFTLEASYGQTSSRESDNLAEKNIMTIGYQIGGYTLIGFEYEIRIHDYAGIHFGGGYSGLTGGLKIHANPKRNSPFCSLSFKAGGPSHLKTLGIDFGLKWVINKRSDFGLLFQAGIARNLQINYSNDRVLPLYILAFGVGLSW